MYKLMKSIFLIPSAYQTVAIPHPGVQLLHKLDKSKKQHYYATVIGLRQRYLLSEVFGGIHFLVLCLWL